MKELVNKILTLLNKEKVNVLYFNHEETKDILYEEPVVLGIKIEPENLDKWRYFDRKVNCCGKVCDMLYNGDVIKFVFMESNSEYDRELLINNLERFYEGLLKKYFAVCPQKEKFSVIVKPTHRCNLDCKYCYDKPYREAIKEDMSMETLDKLFKLLSEHTERVTFIWHGGEPTMVGTEWYEKAYREVISKYPMLEADFSLMSNGTLYDDKWFDLFQKYEIDPGASYNAYCQTKVRCSSQINQKEERDAELSKKIENTLIRWREKGKPIGVIDVINNVNYKNQIEIYEYYKKIGVTTALNNIFHTPQTEKNKLEISTKDYVDEFLKYFKYWLYDKGGVHERSAVEALAAVIGDTGELTCRYSDCRYSWLGINPLGEIYPCDRYYPEKYRMGNVCDFDSIEQIIESSKYQSFCNEVQKRFDTHCKKCGYWFVCKGGCNGSSYEACGNCEGVEEFQCETFRLKYVGVYEILRDLDWVGDKNLNPYAYSMLINKSFYSVKEIKDFIKDIGMNFKLEYDKNNLLECSEYKIFRGINFMSDDILESRHVDFIDGFTKKVIQRNKEKRKEELLQYINNLAISTLK